MQVLAGACFGSVAARIVDGSLISSFSGWHPRNPSRSAQLLAMTTASATGVPNVAAALLPRSKNVPLGAVPNRLVSSLGRLALEESCCNGKYFGDISRTLAAGHRHSAEAWQEAGNAKEQFLEGLYIFDHMQPPCKRTGLGNCTYANDQQKALYS